MNHRQIRKVIVALGTVTGMVFLLGQGCSGQFASVTGDSSSSSTSSDAGAGAPTGPVYNPNTQTLALVYGKQILDHYDSCIGSGTPTDRTLQMYSSKQGTVSANGNVSTLNGPMLMAATSIAGEICEDLILQEKTTPRIFIGFDFASMTLPTTGNLQDAIRRIARSCWSRNEDTTESQLLMNAVSSSFGTASEANKTHDAALFMCTTMLGSLDSLVL